MTETMQQARRRLTRAGIDFQSDNGGGYELYRAGQRVGRVYSDAGLITFAQQLPAEHESAGAGAALSVEMQRIAHDYLAARKRAGDALLDQARHLADARAAAKHGEWGVFLEATQTSEDWAGRLLNIHDTAMHDPAFAAAIRSNFLNLSTAHELASAPADLRKQLLDRETPPTRAIIREEKRAVHSAPARNVKQDRVLDDEPTQVFNPALIVGQRVDPHQPDPKEPPAPTFEDDDEPRPNSSEYKALAARDQRSLEDAEIAIANAAYSYARQLLDRVRVKTYARDQLRIALARAVLTRQRERLTHYSTSAMVSQADHTLVLDQIAALLDLLVVEA